MTTASASPLAAERPAGASARAPRRVVITGIGAVSPLGIGLAAQRGARLAERCGIGPIRAFDPAALGMRTSLVAEVPGFDATELLGRQHARRTERFAQLALVAAREAFAQAGLEGFDGLDRSRTGCIVSSGIGGLEAIAAEQMRGLEKGFERVSPTFIPRAIVNIAAGSVAIDLGLHGPCTCVSTACAASAQAIGEAMRAIRHGYADVMLAGGCESTITPLALGGFASMRALHEGDDPARASIPFDRERSGFVMGEGAAILVLESEEHARSRGARIVAEVSGYGATCDAHHVTAPDDTGAFAAACMAEAIRDAGLAPERIGYVNAHGTSTPLNDAGESKAIDAVFGPGAVAVSSTKSLTGHLLGAAGALEASFCALAVSEGLIPANSNLREADDGCALDLVRGVRRVPVEHALTNSFGFGGHNASLVISRA